MLTVVIGWDPHEVVAWHVLAHSIMRRASRPVTIKPVMLSQLKHVFNRPRDLKQSTEFAFSRFLTPWLAEGGTSVFLDADMLCLTDICELEYLAADHLYDDVLVVKHDYTAQAGAKFRGFEQTHYPCKNWSSVMVFNGHRMPVKHLLPAYVEQADPMELHQFKWATSVGELTPDWNHLVGEYAPNPHAKIVHFTRGGPWFKGYENCEYAQQWFEEFESMCHCETYDLLKR